MDNKHNQETLVAFTEAADIKAHPEKYKCYNTAKEMYEDIMNCTPKVRLLEVQFFHEQILRRIQNQSSTNGFRR